MLPLSPLLSRVFQLTNGDALLNFYTTHLYFGGEVTPF